MNLSEAVARFPKSSPYRSILKDLCSKSAAVRQRGLDRADALPVTKGEPYETTWAIDKRTALALADVVGGLPFPPQQHDWNDSAHELIFPLVQSPYPELVPKLRAAYATLTPHARCSVLAILGAIGTRPAAEAFLACVREHGWPPSVFRRVFDELPKLGPHARVLFPALFENAGKHFGDVVDAFVDMVARGTADPSKLELEGLAPAIAKALGKKKRGLDTWLDLAGYLKAPELGKLIRRHLANPDPKAAAFAAIATLRRGGEVPARVLEKVAANHATRTMLFHKLVEVGAEKRFPAKWRTWDAFAAAEMVEWLVYPSELGKPPQAIEQMHVITARGRVLYVWRFRESAKQPWLAGVSGPYTRRGAPRPQHGHLTFSRFDKWDAATPEEHAEAIAKQLADWRKAR